MSIRRYPRRALILALTLLTPLLVVAAPTPAGATDPGFAFADVVAQPGLTDAHARVFRLYEAFFDREPEPGGAQFWVNAFDQCWTLQHITAHFAVSDEFVATYGPAVSDTEFIDIIYANVLGRTPDPTGRAFWAAQISSGTKTRAEVMLDFSWSPEFSESLPYPFDGVANLPCSEAAGNRAIPGSAGGIKAADLPGIPLPSGACPAGATPSWADRPDSPILGDFDNDQLVDAAALVTCTEAGSSRTATIAFWRGSPAAALTRPDPEVIVPGFEDEFDGSILEFSSLSGEDGAILYVTAPILLDGDPLCCATGTLRTLIYSPNGVFLVGASVEVTPWDIGRAVASAAVEHDRTDVADYISAPLFASASAFTGAWRVDTPAEPAACTFVEVGRHQCSFTIVPTDGGNLGIPGEIALDLEFRASDRAWIVTAASAGGS